MTTCSTSRTRSGRHSGHMRSARRRRTAHVPNTTLSPGEVARAILRPLALERAEQEAAERIGLTDVVLFQSARGALSACVRALAGDRDVGVPAYTCAAVVNAVLSAGKTPVFVDVDSRGLVPREGWPEDDLPLVQDTYGFPADGPAGVFVRDSAHRADSLATA